MNVLFLACLVALVAVPAVQSQVSYEGSGDWLDSNCESGWTKFNDKCYQIFDDVSAWDAALTTCLDNAAILAVVAGSGADDATAQGINEFLAGLAAGNTAWLGGYIDVDLGFSWLDLSQSDYVAWAADKPSEVEKACVFINSDGQWEDSTCDQTHAFICQKGGNIARGSRDAQQRTTYSPGVASRSIDGSREPDFLDGSCSQTKSNTMPWWGVDLGMEYEIQAVVITNRNKKQERLKNFIIAVTTDDSNWPPPSGNNGGPAIDANWERCGQYDGNPHDLGTVECPENTVARYLAVYVTPKSILHFCEADIFGIPKALSHVPDTSVPEHQVSYLGADCDSGWSKHGDRCYKVFNEATSWDEALNSCFANEAKLALISGKDENDTDARGINQFLQTIIGDSDAWIGGYIDFVYGLSWLDLSSTGYKYWAANEPNEGPGSCVTMDPSGVWSDQYCTKSNNYICQKGGNIARGPRSTSQRTTFESYDSSLAVDGIRDQDMLNGHCMQTKSNSMPWWGVDLGMEYRVQAVVITNRNKRQDRLTDFIVAVTSNDNNWVPPGGNDGGPAIDQEWTKCGQFDGDPGDLGTLECDTETIGRYLAVYITATMPMHFCEADVFGIPVALSHYPETSAPCDDDWVHFEGICYKAHTTALGWEAAEAACLNDDTSLAVIPNNATNIFLNSFMQEKGMSAAWVGGELYAGGFTWYDDSPEHFMDFDEELTSERACVSINAEGWLQDPCDNTFGYICQHGGNIAIKGKAKQSSDYPYQSPVADLAVDGNISPVFGESCSSTKNKTDGSHSWWSVDMGQKYKVSHIYIVNREEYRERLKDFIVVVSDEYPTNELDFDKLNTFNHCGQFEGIAYDDLIRMDCADSAEGRYMYIFLPDLDILTLCEVQAYGTPMGWDCRVPGCLECTDDNEHCVVCDDGMQPSSPDGKKCVHASCECSCSGDVHCHTCDHAKIDFQGDCTYLVSEAADSCVYLNNTLEPFKVMADLHRVPGWKDTVSYVYNVYVDVYGYSLKFFYDVQWLDGVEFALPITLDDGRIVVTTTDDYIITTTDFGLEVKYRRRVDTDNQVYVSVPYEYMDAMCGICGNFNGIKADDLYARGGNVEATDTEIGDSYYIENPLDSECIVDTSSITAEECSDEETAAAEKECGAINTDSALAPCRDAMGENVATYFENCVFDACVVEDAEVAMCTQVEAMVGACNKLIDTPVDWRDSVGCPIECDENSHYKHDITSCPLSCQEPDSVSICFDSPVEGCVCDDGFVRSGDNCASIAQCGCSEMQDNNTLYHELGDTWTRDPCGRNFECQNQEIIMVSDSCSLFGRCVEGDDPLVCVCNEGFIGNGTFCSIDCPVGQTKSDTADTECVPCEIGFFKDVNGADPCTSCSDALDEIKAYTTESTGSVSSDACVELPDLCKTGMTPDLEDPSQCVPCDKDFYKETPGQDLCTMCPDGFLTESTGATSIDDCLENCSIGEAPLNEASVMLLQNAGEIGDCAPCPIGTYKDSEGRDTCSSCPEGSVTSDTGATLFEDCLAPATTTVQPTTTTEPIAVDCEVPNCEECYADDRGKCLFCLMGYSLWDMSECYDERIPCDNPQGCHDNATCTDEINSENGFCECNEESRCGDGVNVCKDQCICRVMGDPVVNTDDGQMILLTDPGLYKMSSDLVNASDACSFSVAVKVTPVVRQQRIMYAASMPRYLRIEFCGLVIHLDQNFRAMIGSEVIEVGTEPMEFAQDTFGGQCAFSISKVQTDVNGEQNFIVLDSPTCGFHVGFEGDGINSVAVIKRPCNPHGGRMTGLCGDCNGVADDLKTCDTGSDVSREADPYTAVAESCRTDDSMDEWQQTFGEDVNAK